MWTTPPTHRPLKDSIRSHAADTRCVTPPGGTATTHVAPAWKAIRQRLNDPRFPLTACATPAEAVEMLWREWTLVARVHYLKGEIWLYREPSTGHWAAPYLWNHHVAHYTDALDHPSYMLQQRWWEPGSPGEPTPPAFRETALEFYVRDTAHSSSLMGLLDASETLHPDGRLALPTLVFLLEVIDRADIDRLADSDEPQWQAIGEELAGVRMLMALGGAAKFEEMTSDALFGWRAYECNIISRTMWHCLAHRQWDGACPVDEPCWMCSAFRDHGWRDDDRPDFVAPVIPFDYEYLVEWDQLWDVEEDRPRYDAIADMVEVQLETYLHVTANPLNVPFSIEDLLRACGDGTRASTLRRAQQSLFGSDWVFQERPKPEGGPEGDLLARGDVRFDDVEWWSGLGVNARMWAVTQQIVVNKSD